MKTRIKSEHMHRLRGLIAHIADPNVRLAIEFAALEFGSERYAAGLVDAFDSIAARAVPPPAPLMLGAPDAG